jgi:hypothetical protein
MMLPKGRLPAAPPQMRQPVSGQLARQSPNASSTPLFANAKHNFGGPEPF